MLGFLFCIGILTIQKDNIQAEVYLDMENTAITDENVIVSAKLSGDIKNADKYIQGYCVYM